MIDLAAITAIARAYEPGKEISATDMQALAGVGGSGGARPKANVIDGDTLWLAKFTSVHDQQPVARVETATLRLAGACGIRTPEVRPKLADTQHLVALVQRFDRRGPAGIPYISARTALGRRGTELGAYTEIVDFMHTAAATPRPISVSSTCGSSSPSSSQTRTTISRTTASSMSAGDAGACPRCST